jgi:hypothetical protein
MTPCGSYKNRRFGGSYRLHIQGVRVRAGTERSSKLLYRQRLVWNYAKRAACKQSKVRGVGVGLSSGILSRELCVWNAAIRTGRVGRKKLASWRGTRYCDVVRSTQEVWDGVHFPGYFRVQIRGFHELLRQNPSSLVILCGWSSISMASVHPSLFTIHLTTHHLMLHCLSSKCRVVREPMNQI